MKRVLLVVVAFCIAASASFAQKKAVSQAQSLARGAKAYDEARALIKGALQNPETKDMAQTWFVAGYIEDQQFSAENAKQILGQQPNEPVMYQALMSVLPYFQKSYELDQLPDDRGRVRPRYTKDIKGVLSANHRYIINAGGYYFDQRDFKKACEAFEQFLTISDMPMFQGEPVAARDSNYMMVMFYNGVASTRLENSSAAIAALERAKNFDYRGSDTYQSLAYEYEQIQDTVNMEKTLEEGMAKYPEERYFLLTLINNYIYSNRNDRAIDYLNRAIAGDSGNPQLYDVMGRVYETGKNDSENAEKYFQKALEIDPNYVEALSDLGRIYYNQGVNKQAEANMINDNKLYQEELAKAKDMFRKALPFFEKARQAKPDEREILIALRGIYYNLSMSKEFDEIDALMGQ